MATSFGPEQTQSFPGHKHFQNGNPRDHKTVSSKRGMGHFTGFQRCILPHSYSSEIQEVPKVSPQQVHFPSLWFGNGPVGIHQSGQVDGSSQGYQDPPVPRRLLVESPVPGNLPTTYPDPLGPVPRLGFGGKLRKIGTDPSAGFQFCRLPVRPVDRSGSAHSGQVDISAAKANFYQGPESLHSQTIHVSDRASNSNRETGVVRSPSHATHSVASETSLVCFGESGQGNFSSSFSPPTSGLVAKWEQCSSGTTFTPSSTHSADIYRCLKQRLGRTLRQLHCKRRLVRPRKSPTDQLFGTKSSFPGPQEFRASLQGPDCSGNDIASIR